MEDRYNQKKLNSYLIWMQIICIVGRCVYGYSHMILNSVMKNLKRKVLLLERYPPHSQNTLQIVYQVSPTYHVIHKEI